MPEVEDKDDGGDVECPSSNHSSERTQVKTAHLPNTLARLREHGRRGIDEGASVSMLGVCLDDEDDEEKGEKELGFGPVIWKLRHLFIGRRR